MSMELREEEGRRERERAKLERRREEFGRDVAELARRPEGRRFFRWLLDSGNIFADDYQPGHLGAYRAGLRSAALRLWRTLAEALPPRLFSEVALGDGNGGTCPEAAENAELGDALPFAHEDGKGIRMHEENGQ